MYKQMYLMQVIIKKFKGICWHFRKYAYFQAES